VANSHLDKPVSFSDGYRQMFARLGPLLGIIFLQIGILMLVLLPIILLVVIAFSISVGSALSSNGNSGAGIIGVCFPCFLIIPAIGLLAYIFIRLTVVTPAIMVEKLGPVEALRRSWDLVKNYWWRTFALALVLTVLSYVVQAGPAFVVQSIVTIFTPRNFVLQQVLAGVITVLTTVLFVPIQMIAITLYYFDQRVRKEGYDIEAALTQRYTLPPPPAWAGAGAGNGQPNPTAPTMPPPSLGQGYGYDYGQQGQYGQYGQYEQYGQGAPTQPAGGQEPGPAVSGGPTTDHLSKQ
jgi:hypothetical protein